MPATRYTDPDGLAVIPVTRCCGKQSFATLRVAEAVARLVIFLGDPGRDVRTYRCVNGWHHLSSQRQRNRHPREDDT